MIEEDCPGILHGAMGFPVGLCEDEDIDRSCGRVQQKAKDLVKVAKDISREYGIPIINQRLISVTPIALLQEVFQVVGAEYIKTAR